MANTIIQLRHSTVQGNVPVSLANGEISINTRDGKLYYSQPDGTITEFSGFTGPSGLNGEIQFNDSGVLGANSGLTFNKSTGYLKAPIIESTNNGNGTNFKIGDDVWIGDVNVADTVRIAGQQNVNNAYIIFGASNANTLGRAGTGPLTYTGAFTATGMLSGLELNSTQSSGDEGGQINLALAATNTTLNGSIAIDIYQNKLRIFETSGTNRGVFIDIANGASSGVGTNLLQPASSTDGWARDTANAAFMQANTPSHVANSAAIYANGAFVAANNEAGVNATQNTNIQYAWNHANAAFNAANTDAGVIFTSSATPPVSPNAGDFWYYTTGDILYEYINDGVSLYWVDITSSAVSTGNLTITSNGSSTADSNVFTLSGITTNGTETEIFVGGISNSRINVSANTTVTYDVVITARRTDVTGFSAGFNLKGVVDNFSGTVADVGSLYENILARDDANYVVDARADDANNSLNIYVTGVAGHTIKWVAKVTKVEVQQ